MGESTSIFYVDKFAKAVVEVFRAEYLRAPNAEDMLMVLEMNKACRFSGMLGSIDCMHKKSKNFSM